MKGNVFQTVIIIAFGVLTVIGFAFFAFFKGDPSNANVIGDVTIWGTLDERVMGDVLDTLDTLLPRGYDGVISYVKKNKETYHDELLDALAAGEGPDIFFLPQDDIIKQKNKIYPVPYESYSARRFKDAFIEGAEIYTDADNVLAFPFIVDPLVMYWNRDILSRENVPVVPKYWVEFLTLSPKMTKRDQASNISQSTVPFGEFQNVTNAKEILSALIMQADNPITVFDGSGRVEVVLGRSGNDDPQGGLSPTESALRYYTEFSNPIKAAYSWNRALPESRQAFLAGDLAFYFGFASELSELRLANPNLNFDVAMLPQIQNDPTPATFGRMEALAIAASTDNLAGSFRIATLLSSNEVLARLHEETGLPPIARSLLQTPPPDDVQPVFYESALISHAWLEPDSERANLVFKDMIESISSGRERVAGAVQNAHQELITLFK